jgi:hypothetical protein
MYFTRFCILQLRGCFLLNFGCPCHLAKINNPYLKTKPFGKQFGLLERNWPRAAGRRSGETGIKVTDNRRRAPVEVQSTKMGSFSFFITQDIDETRNGRRKVDSHDSRYDETTVFMSFSFRTWRLNSRVLRTILRTKKSISSWKNDNCTPLMKPRSPMGHPPAFQRRCKHHGEAPIKAILWLYEVFESWMSSTALRVGWSERVRKCSSEPSPPCWTVYKKKRFLTTPSNLTKRQSFW